jgi:hypothetical protein
MVARQSVAGIFAVIFSLFFDCLYAKVLSLILPLWSEKMTVLSVSESKELRHRHEANPLLVSREIVLQERTIKTGSSRDLIDANTGEIHAVNAIYQRKLVDSERYAKIYLDGVSKTFGLTKTAQRVFQVILKLCQKDTDRLYLNFMMASKIDEAILERTYHRGLLELLKNGFVAYSDLPNMLWINPHLFFNGDRVRFITEYQKISTPPQPKIKA